jgi:hypothetical protein
VRTYDPNLQIIWLMTRCLHYSTVFTIYIEAQRSRKLQLDASSACHTLYYFSMTFYGNVFVVSSVVFVPLQFSSSQVPIPVGENCWSTCLTLRVLNLLDVVPGEGTEGAGTIAGTDVPSVVALFQHVHRVAFEQFQLVVVLGEVLEHGAVWYRFRLGLYMQGLTDRILGPVERAVTSARSDLYGFGVVARRQLIGRETRGVAVTTHGLLAAG